ncbi:EbsA family protein [Fructilactobacillus florum]|uniref:EbsA family protein n=1 Tax=Fructilactobacillus florum TaxID=640331 RepID=UPI0005545024|nr:EbsA family protein [Fructilactobacillus florum]
MVTQKRKFLYQPQLLTSCIYWSWTLIVLFVGIIIWLEITHFQNITLAFLGLFLLLCWLQIYFRRIYITKDEIEIHRVLNPFGKKIKISDIHHVSAKRNTVRFETDKKTYTLLLPTNSVIEFTELIGRK